MQLYKFVKFVVLSSSLWPFSESKTYEISWGSGKLFDLFSTIDIKVLQALELKDTDTIILGWRYEGDRRITCIYMSWLKGNSFLLQPF